MAITKKNLRQHELIGLYAEVVDASNKASIGLKGKVVDETQKMLTLQTEEHYAQTLSNIRSQPSDAHPQTTNAIASRAERGYKQVFKRGSTFKVKLPDEKKVELNGDDIAFRPWERISK